MSKVIETISLFCKEGSSDKFYTASIIEDGDKYSVPFTYGRRGTSGQSGIKVEGVSLEAAKKVYDKLVRDKMCKGYKPDGEAITHVGVVSDKVMTGILPQLPNPITEEEAEGYFKDTRFGAQEKHDGKHIILVHAVGITKAINKKGIECGYPSEFEEAMKSFLKMNGIEGIMLDGEAIGSVYHAYDILDKDGKSLKGETYEGRYKILSSFKYPDGFKLSELARTGAEKRALYERLIKARKEGIVFKRLDAPYVAGRPSSYGSMLKYKFYSTLSAIVIEGREGKRAVGMELINENGGRIKVGNVTIPPNKDVPNLGDVIEVRYLYCLEGGSLYQPTYLVVRDDIDVDECKMSQIKYKGIEED